MLIYNRYGWYIVIRPKANSNTLKLRFKANKKVRNNWQRLTYTIQYLIVIKERKYELFKKII